MSRNTVKVCIRTRPTQHFAQENLLIDNEHNTINVYHVPASSHDDSTGPNNRQNSFRFSFDHIFHNSSQGEVYDLYIRDTIHNVVLGINGAIMTYGQTGSGKTFTMVRHDLVSLILSPFPSPFPSFL